MVLMSGGHGDFKSFGVLENLDRRHDAGWERLLRQELSE